MKDDNSMSNEAAMAEHKAKSKMIMDRFQSGCSLIKEHGHLAIKSLFSNMDQQVSGWVDNANCRHSISSIFSLKKQAIEYTEELVDICKRRIKDETNRWINSTFVPLVSNEISSLAASLGEESQDYSKGLSTLKVDPSVDKGAIVRSSTPSDGNKAASVGLSILVGGLPGAIMGGFGGFDALMKTLGCEVAAAVALVIISMFTPVGILGIVLAVLASCFAGGNMALSSIEKKIKANVVEKLRSTLKSELFIRSCTDKIDNVLDGYFQGMTADFAI